MIPKAVSAAWHAFVCGDRNAFGGVYEYFHQVLTAYCLGRLKDTGMAENAASEVMVKLLNHPQPKEIEHLESWLFIVARNYCNTSYTRQQKRQDVLTQTGHVRNRPQPPEAELRLNAESVDKVIQDTLNDTDYRIWSLHQQGYKNNEIAVRLSLSEKTIANRKSAARAALRKALHKPDNL